MDSTAVDLDHVVEFGEDGFDIRWRGSDKDQPIMASTMSWTMFLTEAQRSAVMPVVFSETEFRMCVRVKKGNSVFWCGIVHAEETTEEIGDGTIAVSLRASDGLGILSNIDWKQTDGSRYTGETKVRDVIWSVLSRLPHSSLIAGTGGEVLVEHQLNQPVTQATNFAFLYVGNGVMDYMRLNPDTFYYSNVEEERVVIGQEFGSMEKFNPDDFTDSRLVLKDIMASLGATICFADGKWHVFDKTASFMRNASTNYTTTTWMVTDQNTLDTTGTQSESYQGSDLYDRGALGYAGSTLFNERPRIDFLRGVARKGAFPVRGVTQKHMRAGSDLLYANGIGYHDNQTRPVWEVGEGFETPLIKLNRLNRLNTANTDNDGSDFTGFFGEDVTYDGLFDTRNRSRVIQNIDIPNAGDDGEIRIHISGNVRYTHKNIIGPGEDAYGTLGIYKQRVEAFDGTTRYRLSRPVRTLRYSSTGADVEVDITGAGAGVYYPKLWQGTYEWIPETDPNYTYAWLDIPLGANNSVIEEGTSSRFMQTDFENLQLYTPPLTQIDGEDNILTKDNDRDHYTWRHDFVYETPTGSGTIQELKIHQPVLEEWPSNDGPNVVYASDGSSLGLGTHDGAPTYRTRSDANTNDSQGKKPNAMVQFQLSGIEVFFGDGTQEFDQVSVARPTTPQGKQILNLNGTRLGANFNNTGNATHGRYVASSFVTPDTTEDNLRFVRDWDTVVTDGLAEMVTLNMLELRGKVRQKVIGTMQQGFDTDHDGSDSILLPYMRLYTDTLDDTTRIIVPVELSYQMTGGTQRFEGFFRPATAEANIGATTEVDNDTTRGPEPPKGNLDKPSGVDLSDFTVGEATDDSGSGTGTGGGGKFGDLFPMFIRRL